MGNALAAITLVNTVLGLTLNAMIEMQRVSKLLMQMQAEGRLEFTDEEKAEMVKVRDSAIAALDAAILK